MPGNQTKEADKKEAPPEKGSAQAPAIQLPKGGGAIRGIGEKFAANPVTGTGSMTVPIATSPGRSGFGPQLSLSYDSGAGNGPFGLGWNLSLPSITRKTDKGLPKYQDAEESDVFILSGAEDLVPVLTQNTQGQWVPEILPPRTVDGKTYRIQRYRPRIEGLFARIECWTNPKDTFWRSISKDNITTWYGKTDKSRIYDPADPSRIFSWLICESYDDKGNAMLYDYKGEDSQGIDLSHANERNRTDQSRSANRYLKCIKYGNKTSRLTQPDLSTMDWLFEVVFDYDEGRYEELPANPNEHQFIKARMQPTQQWPVRQDAFSSYRSGFEVRTYRLCHRVLMFHHFKDELGIDDYLVRSTEFTYSESPIASFITSVTQSGYKHQSDETYLRKSLPPLEFAYSKADIQEEVREIDPESLENLPYGLDGAQYQWVDLDGEGISGILTEQAGGWFYKRNLSPMPVKENGKETVVAHFAPLELVAQKPSLARVATGQQQFLDLAGDGKLDLVQLERPLSGFYERTDDAEWEQFRPFISSPNIDWGDPNLKFVDLTGDGHADVLITEHEAFTWYPSLAEEGFGPSEKVRQALDEEKGPRLVFADGTQSIYLADISGDGLSDLVRIRNGEVCYWPNLGYGRFGKKVTMDNAPYFDHPELFDQKRIRLADIDGSGTTDIIYLAPNRVNVYRNQTGNSWASPEPLMSFPQVDNLASVTATDLLGNGTACLVWSSPLPGDARRHMRYIDLMGGQKPHLLIKSVNNLGAETQVHYAASTKFYLEDKRAKKPWITRIPFPVHVVERVETYDHISRNRFVTRYAYHHGYFDGEEREFRGFGMVEQWDTEEFASLSASGDIPVGNNIDVASHVPPVLTKTWFHTGAYIDRNHISNFFAGLIDVNDIGEYYREPAWRDNDIEARKRLLDDTVLPDNLSIEEEREACRALKGSMLRHEVYALDGTGTEDYPHGHPYTVTEQNFTMKRLQVRAGNRHGVFFSHAREAINYHYERKPADPRLSHTLTLDVDKYGNVLKQVSIGYGRRPGPSPLQGEDKKKQEQTLITYTENEVTNPIEDTAVYPDDYRTPLPCEARTYELTGIIPEGGAQRFSFDELTKDNFKIIRDLTDVPYQQPVDYVAKRKRLIEHVRTLYRKNDLTSLLSLKELQSMALPGESFKLSFTPGLLGEVYKRKKADNTIEDLLPNPTTVLAGEGGYKSSQDLRNQGVFPANNTQPLWTESDANDHWWIPSGKQTFDPVHFYLPIEFIDPFGNKTTITYEAPYYLLLKKTEDPLHNTVETKNDYRVLQPKLVTDPNGNRAEVAFDALGLVAGTAVMGKENEPDGKQKGDLLDGFGPDLIQAKIDAFLATPREPGVDPSESVATQIVHDLLGQASARIVYDLGRFKRLGKPPFAATIAREKHVSDLAAGERSKLQVSFSYSDGFGREIQKKIQAEPGQVVKGGTVINPRWVGSGWTIFNNKGKPVRQYEPFFDNTHDFKFGNKVGVSPILFYDPVERVVATLHPNHTYEKVVFDPWRQVTWDVNDTTKPPDNPGDPPFDPKNDTDVGHYFRRLPDNEYLPTWYDLRTDTAKALQAWPDTDAQGQPLTDNVKRRAAELRAAAKAAAHADTPTTAHFDTLGRPFLTLADNGADPAQPGQHLLFATRVELDIEGNQRAVRDAIEQAGDKQGRIVMRYAYDMLGNRVHQLSMEAGARWMLNDVAGKPIRTWDSRRFLRRMTYDELRRPIGLYVTENSTERLAEKTIYGEAQGDAANHRTRVYQVRDGAGIVNSVAYDFKGNQKETRRDLLLDYKHAADWNQNPSANGGSFTNRTTYDALNRPMSVTAPDNSVIRLTFNEANLLDKVDVNLCGAAVATPFVTNINYNAKGQRQCIDYGNGASTFYDYDPLTFRLIHLLTRRNAVTFPNDCPQSPTFGWPGCQVQNLHYTYDPAGNITHIQDDAQQTIYFKNQRVEPSNDYTYDAIYRLTGATGREHLGQIAGAPIPHSHNDAPRVGIRWSNNDGIAMGTYTERYVYDAVGNFLEMQHRGSNSVHTGWTRRYTYGETSLIEDGAGGVLLKTSNRLSSTTVGTNPVENYVYDVHGNITRMPHLGGAYPVPNMFWDYKDQLRQTDLGGGGMAYYVYDAAGQRVRKVWEKSANLIEERIYLGGFEIFRRQGANPLVRETLHIIDDKQRIALVETRTDTPVLEQLIRYQFGNHLGSASLELDEQAQIISYEEYTPYGSTSYQAVRSQTETPKRYRYTGKERDEESGLYYHGARYYASWLGRWISCDPIDLRDSMNLYAYSRNSPVRFRDDSGKQSVEPSPVNKDASQPTPPKIADVPDAGLATEKKKPSIMEFFKRTDLHPKPGESPTFKSMLAEAETLGGVGVGVADPDKLKKLNAEAYYDPDSNLIRIPKAEFDEATHTDKFRGTIAHELKHALQWNKLINEWVDKHPDQLPPEIQGESRNKRVMAIRHRAVMMITLSSTMEENIQKRWIREVEAERAGRVVELEIHAKYRAKVKDNPMTKNEKRVVLNQMMERFQEEKEGYEAEGKEAYERFKIEVILDYGSHL